MWIRIVVLILTVACSILSSGAEEDLCQLSANDFSQVELRTDGWVTHTACSCNVTMATGPDRVNTTVKQETSGLYIFAESTLIVAPNNADGNEEEDAICPPQVDVSPSASFTFHFCPVEVDEEEGRGRRSTFHLKDDGEINITLYNPHQQSVDASIMLSGSGPDFRVACNMDSIEPTPADDSCPCMPSYATDDWPYYTESFNSRQRVIVGVVATLFFIILIAAIAGFLFYRNRKNKADMPKNEKTELANQNPAFEAPDPMYAEIGGVKEQPSTPPKQLNLNQLPFTPDPNLRLGLDARYSMDSGLYSEPMDVDRVVGHGALEGPSIMRISQTSLSRVSHQSSLNNNTHTTPNSHNPVVMNPMTPDEIDALYAKPNKGKYAQQQQKQQPPQQQQGSTTRNSSNQSLPSFRDPLGSQQLIPPPLATGSRSNSHNNVYNNAPLGLLPLQQQCGGGGGGGGGNNNTNGSSSMSFNVSTQETDV